MGSLIDSFTLGLSGVHDLVDHAIGIDSHFAADRYAEQVAAERAETENLTPEQKDQVFQSEDARARALDTGGAVVTKAAKQSVDQVAAKVGDAVDAAASFSKTVLWVGAGILALGVVVFAVRESQK